MFEILGLIFILLFLLWIPYVMFTHSRGAPFVPVDPGVVDRALNLAEVKEGDTFYELGSGDGRVVTAAAMRGAKSIGVEVDFLRVCYSRFWIWMLRLKNASIIHDSFYNISLNEADVVYLYLLPETNAKLEQKLKTELSPGSRVISVAFEFPNWQPEKIDPRGTIYGPIHLYII